MNTPPPFFKLSEYFEIKIAFIHTWYLKPFFSPYGKKIYALYGYPLPFEMVYFNGMFIKELKTYARIFLL